jgi:hypothetical protein
MLVVTFMGNWGFIVVFIMHSVIGYLQIKALTAFRKFHEQDTISNRLLIIKAMRFVMWAYGIEVVEDLMMNLLFSFGGSLGMLRFTSVSITIAGEASLFFWFIALIINICLLITIRRRILAFY